MIQKLYDDISRQLSDNVPALKWIELEYGQLEMPLENYPVQFPCALIDFVDLKFQDETRGNQQADVIVRIRLALDLYEDLMITNGTDAPQKNIALQKLQIITDIHKVLQMFETDYFNKMTRISITTERRDDGIKVFSLDYTMAAKDDSAATVVNAYTGAGLQLNKA